jgi:hypothetical protein
MPIAQAPADRTADPAERQLLEESRLVTPPRHCRAHSNSELTAIVRLLALCRTGAERQIVVYHLFHRQELSAVAERIGQPLARVGELFDSVRTRETAALLKRQNDDKLARWAQQNRYHPEAPGPGERAGGKVRQ